MLNAFVVPKPAVAEVCTPNPVLITGFIAPFVFNGATFVFNGATFVFNGAVPNTFDTFVWFGTTLNGVVYVPNVPELNVSAFGVFDG
jgi:hypothetical protein